MLPTFITIGGMKCGTGSLHRYLGLHPEIGMSAKKELDFFRSDNDFARGIDWYSAQFPDGYAIRGETGTNYSKSHGFPGTAKRMHSVLPGITLIYLVRHPVERLLSHYVHNVANGNETRPFEKILDCIEDTGYSATSRYGTQIGQYLRYYSKEQILVVLSEDLLVKRNSTLSQVFRFLGASSDFTSPEFQTVHNTSSSKVQECQAIAWLRRQGAIGKRLAACCRRRPLRWICTRGISHGRRALWAVWGSAAM